MAVVPAVTPRGSANFCTEKVILHITAPRKT